MELESGQGAEREVVLDGKHTVWQVTSGGVDLFAVDTVGDRPRFFIARLKPGTMLMGSPGGSRYVLGVRPEQVTELRQIPVAEIAEAASRAETLDAAMIERGIEAGLSALQKPMPDHPSPGEDDMPLSPGSVMRMEAGDVARITEGVCWVESGSGGLRTDGVGGRPGGDTNDLLVLTDGGWVQAVSNTTVTARGTTDLLAAGTLWHRLTHQYAAYLHGIERQLEKRHQAKMERRGAGRAASAAAVRRANQALRTIAEPSTTTAPGEVDPDDAAVTACRLVAETSGIEISRTAVRGAPNDRVDPVTRIAAASGVRTRPVRLTGSWWLRDVGPLVAYRSADGLPVVLIWRHGHYQLTEPGVGRRRVTADVAADLAGTAVMFYRSLPDDAPGLAGLLRFGLRGSGGDLVRMLFAGLAGLGVGLAVPIATGQVLGNLVPFARTDLLVQVCLALVVAGLVSAVLALISSNAVLRLQGRLDVSLQSAVWDRLLRLPVRFFTRYSTGELAGAATGISGIRVLIGGVGVVIVSALMMILVNLALMLWLSVPLGLLAVGLLLVHLTAMLRLGLRQIRWQRELVTTEHRVANLVFHTLRGLPKLRVAGAEGFAYARWADDFALSRRIAQRVLRIQNRIIALNAVYVPGCVFVLFLMLSGPVAGALGLPDFLTFLISYSAALTAATQIANSLSSVGAAIPTLDKVRPILEAAPERATGGSDPGPLTGDITLSAVSFRYAEGTPLVLDGIDLHIRAGEFVAVVGTTGGGKSTLLRLLIGFERPTSGVVRYDSIDLAQLDLTEVRRQCGIVLQQAVPTRGTVLSNIRGAAPATLEEAWEAATMAGLDKDIKAMPMGMHTLITDGGGTLSGGQRQRLMIAQALIRRPRILFFDEATSALDNEAQSIVTESTRALSGTRVVIAHRLSTIMNADRVIVLAAGQVTQSGAPATLLSDEGGVFHQLVRHQIPGLLGSDPVATTGKDDLFEVCES